MDKEPFISSLQSLCSQLCTSLERLQIRTEQCNTKGNGAGSIQSVNQPMRKISSPCCKASKVIADIQGPLDDLLFNVHTNAKDAQRRTKDLTKNAWHELELVKRLWLPVTGERFSILIPTIILVNGFQTLQLQFPWNAWRSCANDIGDYFLLGWQPGCWLNFLPFRSWFLKCMSSCL